jgi:putative flippase GtrA
MTLRSLVRHAWSLKWRFAAYAIVGASGVPVNLAVFTAAGRLLGTGLYLLASALAFLVALLWNFSWNYVWTFRGRRRRSLRAHLGLYAMLQVGALALNLITLYVWALHFGSGAVLLGQFIGVLVGCAWGFGANLRWNFSTGTNRTKHGIKVRRLWHAFADFWRTTFGGEGRDTPRNP